MRNKKLISYFLKLFFYIISLLFLINYIFNQPFYYFLFSFLKYLFIQEFFVITCKKHTKENYFNRFIPNYFKVISSYYFISIFYYSISSLKLRKKIGNSFYWVYFKRIFKAVGTNLFTHFIKKILSISYSFNSNEFN